MACKCSARPGRGNSIIASPDDYVCLDLETTGLSPKDESIIEFAAYRVRSGKVTDRIVSFVRPYPGNRVTSFITNLTGITPEMVADAPLPEDILPQLFEFIGNDMVVGHNTCFDMNFLYDGALKAGLTPIPNDFTDTMRHSRKINKGKIDNHRLGTLADYLGVDVTTAHRAAADVETTIRCYELMLKERTADIPVFDE